MSAKTGKTVVHAARKGLIDRREWNERGKGDKRSIEEAKGGAFEKAARPRQLLSPRVGSV